jgi:hypothetical protein
MHRLVFFLCIAFAFAKTEAALDCSNTSSIEALKSYSLELCETSPQCLRRFYVRVDSDVDEPLFDYLMDRMLDEMRLNVSRPLEALCSSNSSASLWLLIMENYSFCTENEFPDIIKGCICRRGKVCHELPAESLALGTATYVVLLACFIMLVLYYGISNAKAIAKLKADYEVFLHRQKNSSGSNSARAPIGVDFSFESTTPTVAPSSPSTSTSTSVFAATAPRQSQKRMMTSHTSAVPTATGAAAAAPWLRARA